MNKPTTLAEINLTSESAQLFRELVEDAGNWSGCPMIGGNVDVGPERRGNLTQLKKNNLLSTFRDEGCDFVSFTPLACSYAESLGMKLCINY